MPIVPLSAALTRLDLIALSNTINTKTHIAFLPVRRLSHPSSNGVSYATKHHHQLSHLPRPRMICWGASCVSMVWSPRISSHVNIIGRLLSQPHHPTRLALVILSSPLVSSPPSSVYLSSYTSSLCRRCSNSFWVGSRASLCFLGLSLTLCTPPPPRTRYIQQIEQHPFRLIGD